MQNSARRYHLRQAGDQQDGEQQEASEHPRVLGADLAFLCWGEDDALWIHEKQLNHKALNIRFHQTSKDHYIC
jgi:hypothetical protein